MDLTFVGIVAIGAMLGLISIGVPIGFALAFVGGVGTIFLQGLPQAAMQLQIIGWEMGSNFLLIAVPLFIFMGQLVYRTGIATDLYDCAHKWFGWMPGGLAVTAVVSCSGFGAVTGSSIAAVATVGSMVMPEMRRHGYDSRLATGSIASAGTLAILIPPSFPMIIYGVWTETSIGKLFIAGIVPGIILGGLFTALIVGRCLLEPGLGPRGPRYSWADRIRSLSKVLPTVAIFAFVIGGIYGGVFTPSEASATGCVGVVIVAAAMRRLTWRSLSQSLHHAGITSAYIFIIILGGLLISRFLVQTEITPALINWVGGLAVEPVVVIALFVLMYIVLGAILDVLGMLILTLPFVVPIVLALGFDPIWFGVFVTVMVELALITPPVGLNVYVMRNVAGDVSLADVFRGAGPFALVSLVLVALLIAFPGIALWLPSTMQ